MVLFDSLTSKSLLISHLASMKLLAILVIICRSAYWNNNNYILLLVVMYMYSASVKLDRITFFNHLNLFILYNVVLWKLRGISISSAAFIKERVSSCKFIGIWDNFEYWENIARKKTGNTIKFQFITMVLWIKNRWKILATTLKQWMYNIKQEIINLEELGIRVFRPKDTKVWD